MFQNPCLLMMVAVRAWTSQRKGSVLNAPKCVQFMPLNIHTLKLKTNLIEIFLKPQIYGLISSLKWQLYAHNFLESFNAC